MQSIEERGATPLKRQIYLSQLAQALMMKGQIEAWRSTNVFGTVLWSLNEIWPAIGWGSLDYSFGDVLGGRWRPLHYYLRAAAYASVAVSCGLSKVPWTKAAPAPAVSLESGDFRCQTRNDGLAMFDGLLRVDVIHLRSGRRQCVHAQQVSLAGTGIGDRREFCLNGTAASSSMRAPATLPCSSVVPVLQAAGCSPSGADCILEASMVPTGSATPESTNTILLAMPRYLDFSQAVTVIASITATNKTDGSAVIDVRSSRGVALFVTLSTTASGRFSENSVFVLPTEPRTIRFLPFAPTVQDAAVGIQELQRTLRVEHLGQHLAVLH